MKQETLARRGSEAASAAASFSIGNVRLDHSRDLLGIGVARPRLSWTVASGFPEWCQAAYEIESIGQDGRSLEQTGRVESGQSVLVPWPFAPLTSRQRVLVRVRVFGTGGRPSE
jgi:alpha-L-rhamnosidase